MELKLQLCVFVLLIQVSLAVWQHVTVNKGQTLILSCPLTNAHKNNVDWKNPEGYVMFFNRIRALKDERYSIIKLSASEFTVSISNITFKDGGNYTCSQYGDHTMERKVEVTVLGHPRVKMAKHDGNFVIKCTAEANHYPPQIVWKLDNGPEFFRQAQVHREDKKYVTIDMLHLSPVENRVTVKCLVRHPAQHSQPLMDFVKIRKESPTPQRTTTTTSPTTQPQGSTEVPRTTTGWFRPGRTTRYLTTRDVNRPSSESSIKLSTVPSNEPETVLTTTKPPLNPDTSTGSHLSTHDDSTTSVLSASTRTRNDTISNSTATTGWTFVSETTEEIISYNQTEGNRTGSVNDSNMQKGTEGNSSLLVFLVTCLIAGLLVVVILFAIKLRRAYIAWKRGIFNTAFTQYVVETPTAITSVINTSAMAATESENKEQDSQPRSPAQTPAKSNIKETEL
ncbi:hypothetical protein ABVT39_018339 [Epinephelus coioides]